LVDGGVQQFLPVEPLFDFSPDLIIASTTIHSSKQKSTGGLIDIISRTMDLINIDDYQTQLHYADIVIEPNVDPFMSSDFHRARALIAAGEAAAEQSMPAIREKIKERRVVRERNVARTRPHPFVRSIRFIGLKTTRASTVCNLVKTKPGMKLDFKRLHSDMTAIYHTGLFIDVNYNLEFMTDDSVAIILEVKEREFGFYAVGMRYDNTDNVVLGIEAGQGNLWGAGASLRAALNLGNPREARFGLTGTRLFNFPVGYRIDGFLGSLKRSYFDSNEWVADYTINYHGALAEAGYILGRDAFFDIGVGAKEAVYKLPSLPIFDSLPSSEWIIGPHFRLEYNTYDDLHLPSHGTACILDATYSTKTLGAANDFVKIDFSFERYLPISSRIRIISGFDIGLSFGTLAWESYFQTGGENLIGFENGYFTTQNRALLHLGLEYHILNFFDRADYPLYGQLLTDIGAFERLDKLLESEDPLSNIHYGVGVGLRTNTPIGPFRLMVGAGDIGKHNSTDVKINYYISIGREFRYTR
jgi:outer membrane protein assembly factor BamA